ncbi:MAG: hypothetical protein JNL10_11510 [Verrucomicrobiales bacterium]|nr:hypothetical protein [Verrucomicrobiales bacterium]
MKRSPIRSGALRLAALLALAAGCASSPQIETLLVSAGFRAVPASTPKQESQLRNLPSGMISLVPRNGTNFYLFPDLKKNVLYVGQQAQYQEYQTLRSKSQKQQEAAGEAALMSTYNFDDYGIWGDAGAVAPEHGR